MPWTSLVPGLPVLPAATVPSRPPAGAPGRGWLDQVGAVAAGLAAAPPADVEAAAAALRPILPASLPTETAWTALRRLGAGDLSAGRLFEGHLNALALVECHGTPGQRARAAAVVAAGGLLAIWAADHAANPAVLQGDMLAGSKVMCSGAGAVAAAVIIARTDHGPLLVWLDAPAAARFGTAHDRGLPVGMQATRSVAFDATGLRVDAAMRLGPPGAFLAEPAFSGGMWRILTLQLGALDGLADLFQDALRAAGRDGHPAQRARLLENAIDIESVALWTHRAAALVEAPHPRPGATAQVALAREVTLRAAEGVLARVARGLGLAAQLAGSPVERRLRDLSTFLRQPAPDVALDGAMAYLLDTAAARRWP